MRIILLEEESAIARDVAFRLRQLGHEVLHTDSTTRALQEVRLGTVDMLVAALFPAGLASEEESGLNLALAAQFRNPDLVTILLSDSALFGGGELFEMLFSLRCVLPRLVAADDLLEIAMHFLRCGPIDCAPGSGGIDVCGHCLLQGSCTHAQNVSQQWLCA